jgi:toxin ParE1/3/4
VKIFWTPGAREDRLHIWTYIAAQNPDAAARIDRLFTDAIARLADFPMIGHEGEVAGTREVNPLRNYRLIYQIKSDGLWILALIHAARRWPPERM